MRYTLALLCLFTACALGAPSPVEREIASRPLTCTKGDDCELRWARALAWVTHNSHWKLRTATEAVITTEGPLDDIWLAYTVLKTPLWNGEYEITFQAGVRDALRRLLP